jgi:hypothetical protein
MLFTNFRHTVRFSNSAFSNTDNEAELFDECEDNHVRASSPENNWQLPAPASGECVWIASWVIAMM